MVNMEKFKGIEYSWTDNGRREGIGIDRLPGRKSVCLYRQVGAMLYTSAYFRSDEEAEAVKAMLEMLLRGALEK